MGFTESPSSEGEYTMQSSVEHVQIFIDHFGFHKINLIGHSRGAFIVARISTSNNDLVKGQIVVDSNTLAPDDPSTPKTFYSDLRSNAPIRETRTSVQREAIANSYKKDPIDKELIEEMRKEEFWE